MSRFKRLKKCLTLENNSGNENPQHRRGRRSALTLEEQVKSGLGILALVIEPIFIWGQIGEYPLQRFAELSLTLNQLSRKMGKFGIPGKTALFKGFGHQQSCGN